MVLNQENSPTTESTEVGAGCPLARRGWGGGQQCTLQRDQGDGGGVGAMTEEVFYFFKNKLFILEQFLITEKL